MIWRKNIYLFSILVLNFGSIPTQGQQKKSFMEQRADLKVKEVRNLNMHMTEDNIKYSVSFSPENHILQVKSHKEQDTHWNVTIKDISGRIVAMSEMRSDQNQTYFDTRILPDRIYIIETSHGSYTQSNVLYVP